MASTRLLIASIALLVLPVASAAPLEAPAGAEVCQGHNPGIHIWVLKYDSGCRELGPPPGAAMAAPEPVRVYPCFAGGVTVVVLGAVVAECVGADKPATVQRCGEVAFQAAVGDLAQTTCIVVVESYLCPGGGGYLVVLGVPLGACRPCCDPASAAAVAGPPVEFTQCDHWGTGVAVYGKQVVCITTGCSPTCTAAAGPHPFPLWRAEPCPEGQGSRVYLTGEDIQVTECAEEPVAAVDLRCQDPGYGVQAFVGGRAVTTCIPLPHGV